MKAGIIVSVLINLIFSKTMQGIFGFDPGISIFWIWLNFTGFSLAVIIAYLVGIVSPALPKDEAELVRPTFSKADFFCKESYILLGFFIFILVFCAFLPSLFL